jgi:NitT/TauT family transport system permease protein
MGRTSSKVQFLFGRPTLIGLAVIDGLRDGSLARDSCITGLEALSGFGIGTIAGSLAGLLLWYWPRIARISAPYVSAFGAVPLFALAPMMIVWFGTGTAAKVALASLSTVGIALVQAYKGACSVEDGHLRLMASFGASRWLTFRKVVVPTSLMWVEAAAKLNVGFAILGAFIGEFISSSKGLGYRLLRAGGLYDIPSVFASLIFLIMLAFLMQLLVRIVGVGLGFPTGRQAFLSEAGGGGVGGGSGQGQSEER